MITVYRKIRISQAFCVYGRGSIFTLHLPVVEKYVREDVHAEKRLPLGKGTILVVDDEEFIRSFAKETLERLGYHVIEASNGIEALDIYSSTDSKIDLVILDLIMPKMGGDETFRRLKIGDPHLKVLIASGYGIGEHAKEIMKDSGVVGFIQKPFTISEIAETVKSVLPSV